MVDVDTGTIMYNSKRKKVGSVVKFEKITNLVLCACVQVLPKSKCPIS